MKIKIKYVENFCCTCMGCAILSASLIEPLKLSMYLSGGFVVAGWLGVMYINWRRK